MQIGLDPAFNTIHIESAGADRCRHNSAPVETWKMKNKKKTEASRVCTKTLRNIKNEWCEQMDLTGPPYVILLLGLSACAKQNIVFVHSHRAGPVHMVENDCK